MIDHRRMIDRKPEESYSASCGDPNYGETYYLI